MEHSIIAISKIAEICPRAQKRKCQGKRERRGATIGGGRAERDERWPEGGHYNSQKLV